MLSKIFFPRKYSCVRDDVENMVEPVRPQMTIWRMGIARWVIKATNTHTVH